MNEDVKFLERDRMRFTKNTLSANLAILAIVFDVLYYVNLYQSNVGSYYYNWIMGVSIVYNLVFLLAAFLSSEGVKNYKASYSWLLLALGVVQLVRVFIYPVKARDAVVSIGGADVTVMENGQFIYLTVCLVLSAVCLIASAVINYSKCKALAAHMKALETKAA